MHVSAIGVAINGLQTTGKHNLHGMVIRADINRKASVELRLDTSGSYWSRCASAA